MLAVILLLTTGFTVAGGRVAAADSPEAPHSARTLVFDDARVAVDIVDADPARAAALHDWSAEAAAAVEKSFGRWPLTRSRIRITRIDSGSRSPLPWGQTARGGSGVSVLLFVRRDAGIDALRDDWSATPELAQLLHPCLGRGGRWLAEGLPATARTWRAPAR